MRIAITGPNGRLGSAVVGDLLGHGHDLVAIDRVARSPSRWKGGPVRSVELDTRNAGHLAGAMHGCDAVIHLAAIPQPRQHPDEVVYLNNTGSTFAVLQAATLLGIERAVIASSLSALGTVWAEPPFPPQYVPVDEAHPLLPADPYSLSKQVDERIGEMMHRRSGMAVTALRFSWIASGDELRERVRELAHGAGNGGTDIAFTSFVEVNDAARACRLAIERAGKSFEIVTIAGRHTLISEPTEPRIRRVHPHVEVRTPIEGNQSVFSIERAKRILDWEPAWTWCDD